MNLNKLLNRNLIIFIFVVMVVGLVIYLTIIYEKNQKINQEQRQAFNVRVQELEQQKEETVPDDINLESIESEIVLNVTKLDTINRSFGEPSNTEILSNGDVRNLYFDFIDKERKLANMYTFVTDSSGKVTYYTYGPIGGLSFKDFVSQRNLGKEDFILGPSRDDGTSAIYVYLDKGVSAYVTGGYVNSISIFVKMDKETYLKYFSGGMPILDLDR